MKYLLLILIFFLQGCIESGAESPAPDPCRTISQSLSKCRVSPDTICYVYHAHGISCVKDVE